MQHSEEIKKKFEEIEEFLGEFWWNFLQILTKWEFKKKFSEKLEQNLMNF